MSDDERQDDSPSLSRIADAMDGFSKKYSPFGHDENFSWRTAAQDYYSLPKGWRPIIVVVMLFGAFLIALVLNSIWPLIVSLLPVWLVGVIA
jgi:hypothetical protein